MNKNKTILTSILICLVILGSTPLFLDLFAIPVKIDEGIFPETSPINSININTPQSTTYTAPMAGYFPATHGFEDTQSGYVPHDWTEYSPGNAYVKVHTEVGGHKKVLRLCDPWQWFYAPYAQTYTTFSNKQFGTIEFWFRTTNANNRHLISLRGNNTERIPLRVEGRDVWTIIGSFWYPLFGLGETIFSNTWYRFKIDFETTNGNYQGLDPYTFKVSVNDDTSKPLHFTNNGQINKLLFSTNSLAHTYSMYIDAVGFSWDPYYDVMDNKYEGLLLEFEPDDLSYMCYMLDGQTRTIYGDTVFPMPKSGSHTIYVYGQDSTGLDYFSDIRTFSVNLAEKIGVMFYASNAGEPYETTVYSEIVEDHIFSYRNVLTSKGYSKFYIFRDVGNDDEFEAIMECLANKIVDSQDEIFFYIWAHGDYYIGETILYIAYNGYYIRSDDFRDYLDEISYDEINNPDGTERIGFLVEGCHSGMFEERFNSFPYLAITSAREDKSAWGSPIYHEAFFSGAFWDAVYSGQNALEAYDYACYWTEYWTQGKPYQEPQISDNTPTGFMFFD